MHYKENKKKIVKKSIENQIFIDNLKNVSNWYSMKDPNLFNNNIKTVLSQRFYRIAFKTEKIILILDFMT